MSRDKSPGENVALMMKSRETFLFQVKKETQQLREFEEGLVSQYKFFLENLEQTVKGTRTFRFRVLAHRSGLTSFPFLFRLETEEAEGESGRGSDLL